MCLSFLAGPVRSTPGAKQAMAHSSGGKPVNLILLMENQCSSAVFISVLCVLESLMPSAQPLRLENSAQQVLHRFPLDSRTEPTFYFYGDSSLSHSSSMTQHHWLIFLIPICCFLTGHTCAVSGCRKELTNGQGLGVMDICGKPTFTEVDHIRIQSDVRG